MVVKALADPTRLRIVDTVRKAAPEALCQCELLPLFDMSQPALSKHLKVLVGAGILATERRGLWAYHYLVPDAPRSCCMAELNSGSRHPRDGPRALRRGRSRRRGRWRLLWRRREVELTDARGVAGLRRRAL